MRVFSLFELFLTVFALYAILNFEGGMKISVSLLCLVIVFLFERLQKVRRFVRYNTQLKAQYFLEGKVSGWNKCTVIAVARKGMGIVFHTNEKISVGSNVCLEITAPGEEEPVTIKGMLKWIKQSKNDFVGGIEIAEILDIGTFIKLSIRYGWEY